MELQRIICNLTGKVRFETFEERRHAVVPVAMLAEAVLNGSGGPVFYPLEEVSKVPQSWNGRPVLVYHSELDGKPISAGDPTVVEKQRVGLLFFSAFERDKLRSEVWIDVAKADQVDTRIMEHVRAGKVMEVSTGLFADLVHEPGEHKGAVYNAVARNFKPDHLALLPDTVGAYSAKDGGGLFQVNEENSKMKKEEKVAAIIANSKRWEEKDKEILMSSSDNLLDQMLANAEDEKKESAAAEDAKKKVDAEAAKAKAEQDAKDAAAKVEQDAKVKTAATQAAEELAKANDPAAIANALKSHTPTIVADYLKALTTEQYIAMAPEGVQGMLANGLASFNKEREELAATITTNASNQFTPEQLGGFDIETLRSIATLAGKKKAAPNYAGAGGAPVTLANQGKGESEPLGLPTIEFKKKGA